VAKYAQLTLAWKLKLILDRELSVSKAFQLISKKQLLSSLFIPHPAYFF